MDINELHQQQKDFFKSQQTKDVSFRIHSLKKFRLEIQRKENDIYQAFYRDMKKPQLEGFASELSFVLSELKLAINNTRKWVKAKKVRSKIANFRSRSKIYKEPFGSTLIISPWNYPLHLSFVPLVGAVAAGNTVLLKPSELSPNTSAIISEIIENSFNKEHVAVVEGDARVAKKLLDQRWDYIFFTGSVEKGKIVAAKAAQNLTPLTLELGGKNPCIIHESANIQLAARRILWGKLLNGGQSCVAPDYVILHESVKQEFIKQFVNEITRSYGTDIKNSPDLTRIINKTSHLKLQKMLIGEKILYGGNYDLEDLFFEPTLVDSPLPGSSIMKDEIFGPILPIFTYKEEEEIRLIINNYERPLSLYVFTCLKSFAKRIIAEYSFGGGTINDTVVHYINPRLPFGGVGHSGIGASHGKHSFNTFTHNKSITCRALWPDIKLKYAPYKNKTSILKFILK